MLILELMSHRKVSNAITKYSIVLESGTERNSQKSRAQTSKLINFCSETFYYSQQNELRLK